MIDLIDLSFESIANGSFLDKYKNSRRNDIETLTLEHLISLSDFNDELEKFNTFETVLLALEAKKMKTIIKKGLKPKKKLKKKKKVTREGYDVEVEGDIDGIEGIDYELVYEDPEIDDIVAMENGVLDKIKNFFKTLWKKFVDMLKRFWNWLKGIFGGNKKKIEELERMVKNNEKMIYNMRGDISSLNEKIENIGERNRDDIKYLNEKIDEVKEKHKNDFISQDFRFAKLVTRLADNEEMLEKIKQTNMLLQQNLDNTKKELEGITEKLNKLQECTTQIEQKLSKHKGEIEKLEEMEKSDNINTQTNIIMNFVNDLKQINSELNDVVKSDEFNQRLSAVSSLVNSKYESKKDSANFDIEGIKLINNLIARLEEDAKRIAERAESIEKTFTDIIENLEIYQNNKDLRELITSYITELREYMKTAKICISNVTQFTSKYSRDLTELVNKYTA